MKQSGKSLTPAPIERCGQQLYVRLDEALFEADLDEPVFRMRHKDDRDAAVFGVDRCVTLKDTKFIGKSASNVEYRSIDRLWSHT